MSDWERKAGGGVLTNTMIAHVATPLFAAGVEPANAHGAAAATGVRDARVDDRRPGIHQVGEVQSFPVSRCRRVGRRIEHDRCRGRPLRDERTLRRRGSVVVLRVDEDPARTRRALWREDDLDPCREGQGCERMTALAIADDDRGSLVGATRAHAADGEVPTR